MNKNIFKTLLTLAIPMMLQSFLHSSLSFMDTFMIGQLGENEIAAVGIAGQLVFIFSIVQFGIHSGLSVHSSQFWGKRDIKSIQNLLGIGLLLGFASALLFFFIAVIIPNQFVSLYTNSPDVHVQAVQYLRIVGLSFFSTAIVYTYTYNLRSTEVVKPPLVASIISVLMNLILNYLFIFGNFGFPALGVVGAATATTLSRIIESVFLISVVYVKKYTAAASLKKMMSFSSSFFKKIIRISWPVFMNELCWVLGISVYNWLYATLGTEAIAAVNIVSTIENLVFTPFFGMFGAGAVIMGNKIGAGKKDEAYLYGRSILFFQFILALITGIVLILFRGSILSLYNISDVTYNNAVYLIIVVSLIMSVKILNYTFNVSIFRGGGDTKYSLFLDFSGVWLIGVPMAILGVFVFHLPVYLVMSMVVLEEIFKFFLAVHRFRSRRWIKNLV